MLKELKKFKVTNSNVRLADFDSGDTLGLKKDSAKDELENNRKELDGLQDIFYADNRYSLLIILQAPDAAGKDGAIRHVMSGVNPQGCRVHSFKSPSDEELDHDYLWRHYKALPERGMIEIFNRSHYENLLITRVHPEYILNERIPGYEKVEAIDEKFWKKRYDQINNFEKHIHENGTHILKFFLNLSKDEQKERFMERLSDPTKYWKFNSADLKERGYWDEYRTVYEEMLQNTSTEYAPWHIIPADKKWFSRVAIGEIIVEKLKSLDLRYPAAEDPEALKKAKHTLENE